MRTREALGIVALVLVGVAPNAGGQTSAPLAGHLIAHGSLLDAPARLAVHDLPLVAALSELQRRSRVSLAYSPTLLPTERRVSCPCAERTVGQALDHLLAGLPFRYAEFAGQVLIERAAPAVELPAAESIALVQPAPVPILGTVVNHRSGRPIREARVEVVADGEWTSSDDRGTFAVLWRHPGAGALRVSKPGYHPATAFVSPGESPRVGLRPSLFARSQTARVSGRVTAAVDGRPLPLVRVTLEGTSRSEERRVGKECRSR